MAIVKVENKTYTVDPLYQWDVNQDLVIRGLSFAAAPEIHFTNASMVRAVRVFSTMDAAGVITARIPNSLLQSSQKVKAHVCTREGDVFKTWYTIEAPVRARVKPADYTITDDPEVYSFVALENLVKAATDDLAAAVERVDAAEATANAAKSTAEGIAGTANAAKSAADEAKTTAGAAQSTAEAAATVAAGAQAAADAARVVQVVVVLTAAGWTDKQQTVAAAGVTADNLVIPGPDPAADNYAAYTESGVRCIAQAADTLTFTCEEAPAVDLTVNVAVFK